jgi:hypothetical protein
VVDGDGGGWRWWMTAVVDGDGGDSDEWRHHLCRAIWGPPQLFQLDILHCPERNTLNRREFSSLPRYWTKVYLQDGAIFVTSLLYQKPKLMQYVD